MGNLLLFYHNIKDSTNPKESSQLGFLELNKVVTPAEGFVMMYGLHTSSGLQSAKKTIRIGEPSQPLF